NDGGDPGAAWRILQVAVVKRADSTDPDRSGTRVRDLPPPRENPSVIGPLFRWLFQWPYRVVLYVLYRIGVRPWQLTMLSLIANIVCGVLLLTGRRFLPGLLLLPAGLFDIFDGGVARLRGEESRKGALLDSVIDRASDGIVFGCLFYAEFMIHGQMWTAVAALAAMVVSLLVSGVRAEGEAAGLEMSEGSVQRLERYVGLMFGLTAPGMLLPVLVVLTVLSLLTTSQRFMRAWRALPAGGTSHG
ncbi:MAG TPA: CDP-alcohol phosphatidyltransferase family protein, partial [Actinomycetota bacterium]|nr:CDP-alcohol phosphatidyltransferase family protein [Actinomycetota bacterium]